MPYSKHLFSTCLGCGNVKPRERGKSVFHCSKECFLKRKRELNRKYNPVEPAKARNCVLCGKEFTPHLFAKNKAKFCSSRCRKQDIAKRFYWGHKEQSSERNRRWREKNKWDGNWWKALVRDHQTCQLCGFIGSKNGLHGRSIIVHHLDGEGEYKTKNHDLGNLMTVCYDCHDGLHGISLLKIAGKWTLRGKILRLFKPHEVEIDFAAI